MRAQDKLVLKTAALAMSSPKEWDDFLAAFREYADELKEHCVSAELPVLQVAQGRARECKVLGSLFEDAVNSAGRITNGRSQSK